MKISLFKKKEITKKESYNVLGGFISETARDMQTMGMQHTGSWNLIFGYVSDSEYASDSETIQVNDGPM